MLQLLVALEALKDRARNESGAVTIEYGVLAVFIALALIAVVGILVGGLDSWFTAISDFISDQPAQGPVN